MISLTVGLAFLLTLTVAAPAAFAATYYVSAAGADDKPGTSPETAWKSLGRVNKANLKPGDSVLFRRGDHWRGVLRPRRGAEGKPVTYSAFGPDGEKPLFLGSVNRNAVDDWRDEGGNIWSTRPGGFNCDVGNIIFDHEKSCGVKVWEKSNLRSQGQYWYDENSGLVKLYCKGSPAKVYSDIECALRRNVIVLTNRSYIVIDGLAVKYGAAHGIGGAIMHHITVRNCDVAYIGGGDQYGGKRTVRYGNGVEFWAAAHDCLVENCRLWEIYDAALTNQGNVPNMKQYNIRYRNNIIWNCEYSFEYWNRPESASTRDIYFENNTCVNAGGGWGHSQRRDPNGRHLCFYTSPAPANNIVIRDNVFYQSTNWGLDVRVWPKANVCDLKMSGNCWYQPQGTMVRIVQPDGRHEYSMKEFDKFQADYGLGQGSIAADPKLISPQTGDFRLRSDSPCPKAGASHHLFHPEAGR